MDTHTSEILRALEESLWRGVTRFDDTLMDQIFAPDMIEFGRSGRIYSRAELLVGSAGQTEINATLPLPDFSVRFLSDDIALVTYTSEIHNGSYVERANRSSIWIQQDAGWRLRFHQGTTKS